MAYFNHAFQKVFLGTKNQTANLNQSANVSGFIYQNAGQYSTVNLINPNAPVSLGVGSFGFFDPKTWTGVDAGSVTPCCPLVLAAAALYQHDQIGGQFTGGGGSTCPGGATGGFHGGYQESNKSKLINPKYVSRYYRVDPCTPNQHVLSIGNTPFTTPGPMTVSLPLAGTATFVNGTYTNVVLTGGSGTGALATVVVAGGVITTVTITSSGSGYGAGDILTVSQSAVLTPTPGTVTTATAGTATTVSILTLSTGTGCCFEFLCDQAYTLRLDIKGSPALRSLTRNSYFESSTWTGCCPPNCVTCIGTPVDPTIVYIYWATQFINSPLVNPFIQIIVYDQFGNAVGGPNDLDAWCAYVTPPAVCPPSGGQPVQPCDCATPGAGMTITGAYVDTKFGDCTFYPNDFFEKEPVTLYASMVDLTGDVCAFTGICVKEVCCPRQGNGFGETVLRDLILSERYLQNDFYTGSDLRIREITQGYDVTCNVNRCQFYTRYYIQHNVPRFNNPTGVFDNDQYLLSIITNGIDTNLEAFLLAWMPAGGACSPCPGLEVFSCIDGCCPIPSVAPPCVADANAPIGSCIFCIPAPLCNGTCGPTSPNGPFTWSISLADAAELALLGLTLDPNTGCVSNLTIGTTAGTANVTITVTNVFGLVVGCFAYQFQVK